MAHEFDGKKYEHASTHQKEWGASIIAELKLMGSERVLDLGCGDGTLTTRIAELLPSVEVVGIDASQGMIKVAREKERYNLSFLHMDIDAMDFVHEFDLVFSNATLHWVKDHQRLLENSRLALRRGGAVRFNFAGEGNCSRFFKVVREAMAMERFEPHFRKFEWPWYMPSITEYQKVLHGSGFQAAKVWGENADRYFPDVETMVQWLDQPSLVPFLSSLPDIDKEGFRDSVVKRMVEKTIQPDGSCFETFRRINLYAEV